MEILRRSRQVNHLHIVFAAELQEAFQTCAGVLRSAAFLAVRKQEHESRFLVPLRFGGRNELIGNDLSAIGEVAILGFPQTSAFRFAAL